MLRITRLSAFGLGVLLVGACGSSGSKAVDIDRNEQVPVRLTVTMKGDINVKYHDTVPSVFIVRRTTSKDQGVRDSQVVGTQPVNPVSYHNSAFLTGFGLVPYVGDRTYTIAPGSPLDTIKESNGGNKQVNPSGVKVVWWPDGDLENGTGLEYMRRLKPCKVVVKDKGTRGSLTCPDVTDENRAKHFSLLIEWEAPKTPGPQTQPPTAPAEDAPQPQP